MAYGRDIVIRLADDSIAEDEVRQSLEKFVTVQSLTASPADAATLHARLLSSKHVNHLLNVLSGKLLVGGRYLCAFARPSDDDSDEEDETLVELGHDSFPDSGFLTPTKSSCSTPNDMIDDEHGSFHDAFLSPSSRKSSSCSSPIAIPLMMDHSSVFLTPPQSLSQSTLGEEWPGLLPVAWTTPASPGPNTTIPIGLHPEITVLDPSPERPDARAPRRRAAELAEIFDRGCSGGGAAAATPHATPQYHEADGGACAFLSLPPPYHLLPNTPYFRNAPIAPPPLKATVPPTPTQRIVNRYLASMKAMDNLGEMEIQSLMCFNFNRTIGYCPYTMPEKEPLALRDPDDMEDTIDEDWSIWSAGEEAAIADHQRTRLTH